MTYASFNRRSARLMRQSGRPPLAAYEGDLRTTGWLVAPRGEEAGFEATSTTEFGDCPETIGLGATATGSWPLVGRAKELRQLRALLLGREPRSMVLAGPSGVGKTRLALECVQAAERLGFATASVSATRATSILPFGAVAPLLPAVHHGGPGSVDDRADLLRRSAVALVERAEGRRLLLFVDDAHLLDDASAALVQQLVATRAASVLVTLRTGERVPDAVVALWKDGLAHRLEVEGLPAEAIETLLSRVLGGPVDHGALSHLLVRSEGNILFLRELVEGALLDGSLRNEGGLWQLVGALFPSDRLVELVEVRLGGLSPELRKLLEVISFGEPLGPAELSGLGDLERLEELEPKGLVISRKNRRRLQISLAHPLYGEVLRNRVSPLRVRSIARSLAEGVEATGGRRREDALRIATWRLEAGGARPEFMLAAAETARWRYDFPLAERLVRAAIDTGAGFEASLLAAQLASLQGRDAEARVQLAALAERATTDEQRGRVAVARVDTTGFFLGDTEEGLRIAEEAEVQIVDERSRDEVAAKRAGLLLGLEGPAAAARVVEPLLRRADGPALVWSCLMASLCFGRQGRLEEAIEATARGYAAHLELKRPISWYPWLHLWFRCEALASRGFFKEAEVLACEQYRIGIEQRSSEAQAFFAWHLARTAGERGRVQTAAHHGMEAVALFKQLGRPLFVNFALGSLALALALAGRAKEATDAVAEIEALGLSHRYWETDLVQGRAWLAAARGDVPRARKLLEQAAAAGASSGDRVGEAAALHCLARLGRASEVVERLKALTATVEGNFTAVRAEHATCLAAEDPIGLARVSEAFEAMGAHLLAAEAAADAATRWRQAGELRLATGMEHRATTLAEHCEGASTPALQALDLPQQLTPAERETALLAAHGHSNKDIASNLILSVRTVENRLQRAYEKLGITSRGELADALGIAPEAESPRRPESARRALVGQ